MAKGLFLATIAVFLVFQAAAEPNPNPLIGGDLLGGVLAPVTGVVGAVTGTLNQVSGTVGQLTGAVTGIVNSVTGIVGTLLETLTNLIETLAETLTKTLTELTSTLGNVLAGALQQPLQIVNSLLDSVTSALNPSGLSGGLTSALGPALKAVTGIVGQLTGTVGCVVGTLTGNVTSEILKGVLDVLKCASPIVKTVTNATQLVSTIVGGTVNLAGGAVQNLTACAAQSLTIPPNIGKIVGCVVDTAGQGLNQVTGVVGSATPIIASALNSALGVPQCAQKSLTNGLSKVNTLLTDVVKCASSKGVTATLPSNLPSVVPNFTAIANAALGQIQSITQAALGPNSPVSNLNAAIATLQSTAASLSPDNVQNAVNNAVKSVVDAINQAASGSSSANVQNCVASAQKTVSDLSAQTVQTVLACATSIGTDVTNLVSQATSIDVAINTQTMQAGVDAFTKCSPTSMAVDNSAQTCFDGAVKAVNDIVSSQLSQVNGALATAQSLNDKAKNCLSSGLNQVNSASSGIVSTLQQCLSQ